MINCNQLAMWLSCDTYCSLCTVGFDSMIVLFLLMEAEIQQWVETGVDIVTCIKYLTLSIDFLLNK